MKLKTVTLEFNDDGTIQIECRCCGPWDVDAGMHEKKYSAKDLKEAAAKIEDAKKEFGAMKSNKKKGTDRKMKTFLGEEDESEDE